MASRFEDLDADVLLDIRERVKALRCDRDLSERPEQLRRSGAVAVSVSVVGGK